MNSETLLLRQINPEWVRNEKVTSQAFSPTPKDHGYLSTYNGDMINPFNAWWHFSRKYLSVGVMAVNVGECTQLHLTVQPDQRPFREHTVIDFTGLSKKERKDRARELAVKANERGWKYKP